MDPLKKVDKDFICVSQGLNTFNITTIAPEEQDHATLREHLSRHNTFPILAQQSLQHWRSENQNLRLKRIQNTGKSSQGAGGSSVTLYVLLWRVSSRPQAMLRLQRISLELHLCKCPGLGNCMVYQNHYGEWTTGVSFSWEVDRVSSLWNIHVFPAMFHRGNHRRNHLSLDVNRHSYGQKQNHQKINK